MSDIEHGLDEEAVQENKYVDEQSITDGTSITSLHPSKYIRKWSPYLLSFMIIFVGGALAAAFLTVGIKDSKEKSSHHFEQTARDIVQDIRGAWLQYETFTLWAHESCHQLVPGPTNSSGTDLDDILHLCSRDEFRNIYEQILSVGMHVHSLQYATKVEHRYRQEAETESRRWMEEFHPDTTYQGFTARHSNDQGQNVKFTAPERPFYFPLHRIEPFQGNEDVYDDDVYYHSSKLIGSVLETYKPVLSPPHKLIQDNDTDAISVFLTHPGARSSIVTEAPHSIVAMTVRISDLLIWACRDVCGQRGVYLYDSTGDHRDFLGAVLSRPNDEKHRITTLPEVEFENVPVPKRTRKYTRTINVVDRRWTVVVVPLDNSEASRPAMYVFGAGSIFIVFAILAILLQRYLARKDIINGLVFTHKNDKADVYQKQVMRERRLNEYLA